MKPTSRDPGVLGPAADMFMDIALALQGPFADMPVDGTGHTHRGEGSIQTFHLLNPQHPANLKTASTHLDEVHLKMKV